VTHFTSKPQTLTWLTVIYFTQLDRHHEKRTS